MSPGTPKNLKCPRAFSPPFVSAYLQAGIVTPRYFDDALHVALATVSGYTLIVSWNFQHIVHFLVTLDLDFAMRTYGSSDSPGIIVIRLPRQDVDLIRTVMLRALAELEQEPLEEGIWILEPDRIRVWREQG